MNATRRRFFAITGAVAAASALRPGPTVAATETDTAAFIRQIAFLHPGGEAAACHALAAGMRPGELYCVMLLPERGQDDLPALLFTHEGEHFTFRPSGRSGQ